MLKLKSPVKLHTRKSLCTGNSDAFAERIKGNYGLIGAHLAPKDLLFLLTAPTELPENLGGMTTLVNSQSNVNMNSVTVDVINNVVNRIMLDGTDNFTYQDQVYITNVLTKLGITNTEQFMTQVRRLRVESESNLHMTKLYREEMKNILINNSRGGDTITLPVQNHADATEEDRDVDPRITMCLNVLKRLGTSQIYETVHAFSQRQNISENQFTINEMRLSEQLRFSNEIRLAETKQQLMSYPRINLSHHVNQYETGILTELPKNEDEVISNAAIAALVSTVDNTITQVINRPSIRNGTWIHVENAIRQSAENTIARFESFHTESRLVPADEIPKDRALDGFVSEINEYRNLQNKISTQIKNEYNAPARPRYDAANITYEKNITDEADVYETTVNDTNITSEITQKILREGGKTIERNVIREIYGDNTMPPAKKQSEIEGATLSHITNTEISDNSVYNLAENEEEKAREREMHLRSVIETVKEETKKQLVPATHGETVLKTLSELTNEREEIRTEESIFSELTHSSTDRIVHLLEKRRRESAVKEPDYSPLPLTAREVFSETERYFDEELHEIRDTVREITPERAEEATQKSSVPEKAPDDAAILREVLHRTDTVMPAPYEIPVRDEPARTLHVSDTAPGDELLPPSGDDTLSDEEKTAAIVNELNRINEKNRTVMQNISRELLLKTPQVESAPDTSRTMRDALRALENPGEVLREIYSEHTEVETVHPTLTPEQEAILSHADPETRSIYEKILSYERSPEAALDGIIKQATPAMLQAEVNRAMTESPAVMEHIERVTETERILDETENVLERFIHTSASPKTIVTPKAPPRAINIVHKQPQPDITEELLEQLEQSRTQQTIKTESSETINRENLHQTDLKQIEKHLVTKTNEDITELVNRTLAKQMRTISDQVYRQMEKRLQTERSRRGRL